MNAISINLCFWFPPTYVVLFRNEYDLTATLLEVLSAVWKNNVMCFHTPHNFVHLPGLLHWNIVISKWKNICGNKYKTRQWWERVFFTFPRDNIMCSMLLNSNFRSCRQSLNTWVNELYSQLWVIDDGSKQFEQRSPMGSKCSLRGRRRIIGIIMAKMSNRYQWATEQLSKIDYLIYLVVV